MASAWKMLSSSRGLAHISSALGLAFTIATAARLKAAVANDSGAGHMIAAADVPLISLFGPTPPAKFAPATPALTIITAQAFGGDGMAAIPLDAVHDALEKTLVGEASAS